MSGNRAKKHGIAAVAAHTDTAKQSTTKEKAVAQLFISVEKLEQTNIVRTATEDNVEVLVEAIKQNNKVRFL